MAFLKNTSGRLELLRENIPRNSLPKVFCKKEVLKNLAKFTGKHLCQSFFFHKVAGLLKIKLWHRCFPVNFAKFLGTRFLTEHLRWLLLYSESYFNLSCLNEPCLDEHVVLHAFKCQVMLWTKHALENIVMCKIILHNLKAWLQI